MVESGSVQKPCPLSIQNQVRMTAMPEVHVVTGAFGYSGKYITSRLLSAGVEVRTLTNSTTRQHSFGDKVEVFPFRFEEPAELARSLAGASVLYNTYWVRFNHKLFAHADAVRNTKVLFEAARQAGVTRIVHVSITNPSLDSELEYFRGKAELEQALQESGVAHSILRPAVLFGHEDVLINNIAWMLRRFPVFGVFGDGRYRLQPIHVEDFADLAVQEAKGQGNRIVEAIGPETFTYRELVETIGKALGKTRRIFSIPPALGLWVGRLVGSFVGDVTITRDEIQGLMDDLLHVEAPAAGKTRLTTWLTEHKDTLGVRYASELARRKNRKVAYAEL